MSFPHVLVINLEEMKERWEAISFHFKSWNIERFNAIKKSPGILGCNLSHLACLNIAKERNLDWVLVLEDDCELISNRDSKAQFEALLPALWKNRDKWDVFSGGSSIVSQVVGPCYTVNDDISVMEVKGLTTHFVLYHKEVYDKIIRQYELTPLPIDVLYQYYFKIWTCIPFLAIQTPGYSSINLVNVNYNESFRKSVKFITSSPQWKNKIALENNTKELEMISDTGYWNIDNNSKEFKEQHHFDSNLAKGILKVNSSKQAMYDFGCGNGRYVEFFTSENIDVKGFDGNPCTSRIANCSILDLTSSFDMPARPFVICLEVGEHVPDKYEDVLLNNIIKHVEKNGLLVLSWAVLGQGGLGHVNCRNNDYIIKKISGMGLTFDNSLSEELRRAAGISWFKNTIMVFKKPLDK